MSMNSNSWKGKVKEWFFIPIFHPYIGLVKQLHTFLGLRPQLSVPNVELRAISWTAMLMPLFLTKPLVKKRLFPIPGE